MRISPRHAPTDAALPRKAYAALWLQVLLFATLVGVSLADELLDLPHHLLGATPTSLDQRWGEVVIEVVTFACVIGLEVWLIQRLRREIRILQGILPVCMHCKSIRHEGHWVPMEAYITRHSMAHFSHGVCPECLVKHHPEVTASSASASRDLETHRLLGFAEPSPPLSNPDP